MWTRIPLATWIALSRPSTPDVDVDAEDQLLAGDELGSVAIRSRYRGRATIRWFSHIANGWVPAEADRPSPWMPPSRSPAGEAQRSCSPASAVFWHGSVEISSTDSISFWLDLPDGGGLEHRLDRIDEIEGLGIEDHQLLLDPDRVRRTR